MSWFTRGRDAGSNAELDRVERLNREDEAAEEAERAAQDAADWQAFMSADKREQELEAGS